MRKRVDVVLRNCDLENLAYLRRAAGIQSMTLAIKYAIRVAAMSVRTDGARPLEGTGAGGPSGYRTGPTGPGLIVERPADRSALDGAF